MAAPRLIGREDGSIMPVLAFMVVLLLGGGLLLWQGAHATVLRATAQTAADAAALAGAEAMGEQLYLTDGPDCEPMRDGPLEEAAADYAQRNGATLLSFSRDGCDVAVTVATEEDLGGAEAGGLEGTRGRASAQAELVVNRLVGTAGPGSWAPAPVAPVEDGTVLQALIAEAGRIDALHLPYVWGGGHQSSPAPPNGPFDCSGAVSRLLQAAGIPVPTMTSGMFGSLVGMGLAEPGVGVVTIYYYDGHVFSVINGRGWGTGDPVTGGAGWLPYSGPYHGLFKAIHLKPEVIGAEFDPSSIDLGDAFSPVFTGPSYEVRLVG